MSTYKANGFSLLEVMVALALLALSMTSLILAQGRSTRLALQASNISIATELARYQLLECKRLVQKNIAMISDFNEEGDFTDLGYEKFKWECHAPKFSMKTPSASALEKGVDKQAKEVAKKDTGATASISAPFLSLITDSLGNSVRELVVIIRWTDMEVAEELRVVTHVIDLTAMAGLSRMLTQGAQQLGGAKKEEKPGENKNNPNSPPPPPPPPPPGGPP